MTNRADQPIRVCVAGITGWAGHPTAKAIAAASDLALVSGVSRSSAGKKLSDALQIEGAGGSIFGTVAGALEQVPADVLVEYTSAEAVRDNVLRAIERGVNVVVGSSGLTAEDYAVIDALATERGVGVVAAGNFSILAALLQRFALQAAAHLSAWEIIDYADAGKPDVPSGTSRELAEHLGAIRHPSGSRPIEQLIGAREARGTTVAGTQIHSVRLPSYVVSTEAIFAQPGERLILRHEAGESPTPYVAGALLAIRQVVGRVGLTRGLDTLLQDY
jgi:4-hydroxy-tetrahydrodipicolinate reductase